MGYCCPGFPLSFIFCLQRPDPKSGKRDLAFSLNLISCRLALLPEEAIAMASEDQLLVLPVSFLFFSPTLSLSTHHLLAFAQHPNPPPHGLSFTSCNFEQDVERGKGSIGMKAICSGVEGRVPGRGCGDFSVPCLHLSHFQSRRGTAAGDISKTCTCSKSCFDSQSPINFGDTNVNVHQYQLVSV